MRERPYDQSSEQSSDPGEPPGAGDADPALAVRTGRIVAGAALVLGIALLVTAFVPQTVAEGAHGDRTWRVTVTPGLISPGIRLIAADGVEQHASGFGFRPPLDATRVWSVPRASGGAPTTVVVGPTPSGTDSVRVTSDVRGVGEANLQQVAWRRVHVAVIDAEARIEELVAISDDGRVLDAVSDLPTSDRGPG